MDKKKKQKDIFLSSEGDQWFTRNKKSRENYNSENDFLLKEILELKPYLIDSPKLLEIGCSASHRLIEAKRNGFNVFGIDPSEGAINEASSYGIEAVVGTADNLPYDNASFDVLVFGFCLYLCDREDLFKIASEANRVLKQNGFILILDFYSKSYSENPYHHYDGLNSYKMDYSRIFNWHPDYITLKQHIGSHHGFKQTNDSNDWVAISVLKKIS